MSTDFITRLEAARYDITLMALNARLTLRYRKELQRIAVEIDRAIQAYTRADAPAERSAAAEALLTLTPVNK